MDNQMESLYRLWRARATEDPDLTHELQSIEGDEEQIRDRFYCDLQFGTGGLRGVLGAGSNRMNIYTVRRATQGLCDYLKNRYDTAAVAISFDSRHKSALFAREAAKVLAGNGITAHLMAELEPTPVLSFAVRELGCQAGIMITASHNPAKYNGYKCYGADGCQMTDHDAAAVTACIESVDLFDGVQVCAYDEAARDGRIQTVPASVLETYYENVAAQQVNPGACRQTPLKVVYTPLNGTGNKPVREMLRRIGVSDVSVVPQQELPNGDFPTCPYPNPEIRQSFECALELAKTAQPDLLLATDPDCDRVGIAVRDGEDYTLMTGNEVGCLLMEYILSSLRAQGRLPEKPVIVTTIVTSRLTAPIAKKYGCELRLTLTGFKYIGEQIGLLEKAGEADRYLLGFEESYGYERGTYVRDKDAVVASMLICEMAAYYKAQGKSLLEVMQALYREHGYYDHSMLNIAFEGEQGMKDMDALMTRLRTEGLREIGGEKVTVFTDYQTHLEKNLVTGEQTTLTLPSSNVLSFALENGAGVIVRPSGTEPKIKAYITATGRDEAAARALSARLTDATKALLR